MTTTLSKGAEVTWRWGAHTAKGRIEQVFTEPVTRTIKGTEVRRNATPDNPAYLVTQATRRLRAEIA